MQVKPNIKTINNKKNNIIMFIMKKSTNLSLSLKIKQMALSRL